MNDIWWQTTGEGNCHLVLLHGWGLNAEVWRCISQELSSHFTLHLVDLPGYGRSQGYGALTLDEMARLVASRAARTRHLARLEPRRAGGKPGRAQ